jgi:hypothetical protein
VCAARALEQHARHTGARGGEGHDDEMREVHLAAESRGEQQRDATDRD